MKIRERKVLCTNKSSFCEQSPPCQKITLNKTAKGEVIIKIITYYLSLPNKLEFEKNSYLVNLETITLFN